ncbi:MAG: FtsX-like permease family protein [Williamsia sp.]|nr:FtsX-like permease family protein [Williamsia sp.]
MFSLYRLGGNPAEAVQTQSIFTDEYFAATFGIPMKAGVFYGPPGETTDSLKLVINEKMAHALGWKNPYDAIAQQVMNAGGNRIFTIAGVSKDFHFGTMQQKIQPLTFYNVRAFTAFRILSVKIKSADVGGSIEALQKQWSLLLPGAPFEYTFMDDTLKLLYRTEIQLQRASYVATTLSFIIVLLGILGLISLSVQKRAKEIGVRKVLGSTVKGILALFMKEIMVTVLMAGVVACPFAYILMNKWLNDYAYRIRLTPVPFLAAILVLGFFTAAVVAIQTIKTALANPVDSLRAE